VSDDVYEWKKPEPLEILVAIETLLIAGFTEEAVCVLTKIFKNKQELCEALIKAMEQS
jgi:hypothetical protein